MTSMNLNFVPLSGENLSAEIAAQIRHMRKTGALNAGDKLPSTRVLARDLGVARGTVISALDTLIAEGVLVPKAGSGTFVSADCTPATAAPLSSFAPPIQARSVSPDVDEEFVGSLNFQACRPSIEGFPRNAWRRAAADAASQLPKSDYGDPRGEHALRAGIASYLCRARGLDVNANEIIITNGAIQAMAIMAVLYLSSDSAVAFEDPGYPLARQCFMLAGATIHSIGVDEHGFRVDELPSDGGNIKLVYVTPSHQFPTGSRLSLQRRQRLLEWAMRNDVLILEDDYDGEFRYDIAPLPPMAAMNVSGFVVYFGTFSKTMFPSLRIGFAAGPESLIKEMAACRTVSDYQTNSLSQLALARFIENGHFERHVQRMRRVYAKKRQCLRNAIIDSGLPGELTGTDSGINAMVRIETQSSATNIAHRARLKNIWVSPISRYAQSDKVADNALILGYGALTEAQIQQGVRELSGIMRSAT